ncbi:I78 family peptidase inhibitor [Gymnodinialimonas hymeniacidonis]|uniref:I78 family peptidase inhibitor n=1 Tax=Gymnodinialimonas hymeniacidonis TaxID=3126508 RepID=UPI0034C5FAF7
MTPSFKAIAAALLVTLTPLAASAQSFGIGHTGPGSWPNSINGTLPTPGQSVGTPVLVTDCGAARLQDFLGRNIRHVTVPSRARVIGPDTIVTFDYRTDRLNIAYEGYGTITRVYCG